MVVHFQVMRLGWVGMAYLMAGLQISSLDHGFPCILYRGLNYNYYQTGANYNLNMHTTMLIGPWTLEVVMG